MGKYIMIVDDEPGTRDLLSDFVDIAIQASGNSYKKAIYDEHASALSDYNGWEEKPILIISDKKYHGESEVDGKNKYGLHILKTVASDYPKDSDGKIPFILSSGNFTEDEIRKAESYGAHCLPKPFTLNNFLNLCEKYLNPNEQPNE